MKRHPLPRPDRESLLVEAVVDLRSVFLDPDLVHEPTQEVP